MITTLSLLSFAAIALVVAFVVGAITLVFKLVGAIFHVVFGAIGFVFGAICMAIGAVAAIGVGMVGIVVLGAMLIPLALPILFLVGIIWAIRAATRPAQPPAVHWIPAPR